MKTNKVPAVDQVAKIRDNLSLHPLQVVPESVKSTKDAIATIKSRYGDKDRVIMLRVKELKKMGPKPDKFSNQVAWLNDLMGKLQRLVDLGDQDDDLAREVFSKDVFSTILNLFSVKEHLKMAKAIDVYGKFTKERMEDIIRRLEEMRTDAYIMDKRTFYIW